MLHSQNAIRIFLTGFVLLSSSVAIAAIMIVSVLKRNKEIGILKSMGAKDRQIMAIFTLEALGVAITGALVGLAGVLAAIRGMASLKETPPFGGKPVSLFTLDFDPVFVVELVAIVITATVLAALWPASPRRPTRSGGGDSWITPPFLPSCKLPICARPITRTRRTRWEVLRGVDMQAFAGEFIAIIGQSGSGKSTLLNILGALDRPTSGAARIDGVDISTLDSDGLAELRGKKIGFVFQFHHLLDEFTCLENALMPVTIQKGVPAAEDVAYTRRLLARVGLESQMQKRPSQMSGGQQQRAAIVRALANRPRLLLADEPTRKPRQPLRAGGL